MSNRVVFSGAAIVILLAFRWIFRLKIAPWIKKRKKRKYSPARWMGLREQGKFAEIANHHRRLADEQKTPYLRNNYLGLAALYDHDADAAARLFQQALAGALGNSVQTVKNNLAIAFMHRKQYQVALNILEEGRKLGRVPIIPYTLALIMTGQHDKARDFYREHPVTSEKDYLEGMKAVFTVKYDKVETLDPLRRVIEDRSMWLYQPILEDLLLVSEVEVFFRRPDRYQVLLSQAKALVSELEQQPTFFSDPSVRFAKNALSALLPRIGSPQGCSTLFGLVMEMEQFVLEVELPPSLKDACHMFWRQLYTVFWRTLDMNYYNPSDERTFINSQLPSDVKLVVSGVSERWHLYRSPGLRTAFLTEPVERFGFTYVGVMAPSYAEKLLENIDPVVQFATAHPDIRESLNSLIHGAVHAGEFVSAERLKELLPMVPEDHHRQIYALVDEYQGDADVAQVH